MARDNSACLAKLAQASFAGPNAKDGLGKTALHWAVHRGLSEVCLALIAREDFVEMNAKDGGGLTALHWAAGMTYSQNAMPLW